jgi:hypothetical protein
MVPLSPTDGFVIASAIGTILANIVTYFKGKQGREIMHEEARVLLEEQEIRVAAALKIRMEEANHEADKRFAEIKVAVAENTDISTAAFKEANSLNLKIEHVENTTQDILKQQVVRNEAAASATTESQNAIGSAVRDVQKSISKLIIDQKKSKK